MGWERFFIDRAGQATVYFRKERKSRMAMANVEGRHMNCTIEQFEDVVAKFKYFAESVELELSSEADGLRQELVVICAELLTTVREEIKAGADSIV
jgi:hypothetical protein